MSLAFRAESKPVFVPNAAAWAEFTQSPSGAVGVDLNKRGLKLAALAIRSVGKHSGHLAASISSKYTATKNPYVTVGSRLSYALLVHDGSRPHLILPHNQKLLRFKVRGRVVYARKVLHPGTKPTKFLTRNLPRVVND